MKKRVLGLLLAAIMVVGTVIPTCAADTDVTIEVKATGVSVTVPTTLPIIFNEDGTNVVPTNWTIKNESSISGVHLSAITMDANGTGWKLLAASEDTKTLPADTKSIKFSAGKEGALKLVAPGSGTVAETGTVNYAADEISIASGSSQVLSFAVERGAFTTNAAASTAFDMVLTFNFN